MEKLKCKSTNSEERKEIFKIQIKKHKRDPQDFNIEKLAEKSDEYNGAEIEECIVSAMFRAWNDGKRPYTTEDIEEAMLMLKPAAQGIMHDTIMGLRTWSQTHNIRNANTVAEIQKVIPEVNLDKPISAKRTKRVSNI